MEAERSRTPQQTNQEEQQQLTIFYNGNICVSDVTELQVYVMFLGELIRFFASFS